MDHLCTVETWTWHSGALTTPPASHGTGTHLAAELVRITVLPGLCWLYDFWALCPLPLLQNCATFCRFNTFYSADFSAISRCLVSSSSSASSSVSYSLKASLPKSDRSASLISFCLNSNAFKPYCISSAASLRIVVSC